MAKNQYKALKDKLNKVRSEFGKYDIHTIFCNAYNAIGSCDLSDEERDLARKTLIKSADSKDGINYVCDGIDAVFALFQCVEAANDNSFDPEPPKTLTVSQLTELVDNGRIFGVSFIKRTTGELRTMSCRLGVKKFLRGGQMAYSPAEKKLLTVFSMKDKGYRCIPVDAIQRVSVGGETFAMGGV